MKHARIARADPLSVPQVRATAHEPNSRILSLLLADRTLTAEEWAEIEAAEREVEPITSFSAILASIDALPLPIAAKLADRIIDRLNAADGDTDLEDSDFEACAAHDDDPTYVDAIFGRGDGYPGDPDDAEDGADLEGIDEREPEPGVIPLYGIDQSAGPRIYEGAR